MKIDKGLKIWLEDFIKARRGNPRLAKQIKANIDKVIREKNLDKSVYFYKGDPDDPKRRHR